MFRPHGFTLGELLIVISILAILSYIALPYFRDLMVSGEANHLKRNLTIHIQKAKTDAQLYHKNVMLCPSNDLIDCGKDWNKGFIGFIDTNKNRKRDHNEPLLFAVSLNLKYGHLHYSAFGATPYAIIFQGENGLPFAANGTFTYCSTSPDYHSKMRLSRMGNIRFEKISSC
ncbi:Type IV fimbrial biogenesis protein FimT [Acinetobacter sp. neg1]|uniref:GspH/FimT family pseudopilin n=1 Tax=Acinetobacter TaxID=469 RepID=UPI000543FDAD|nr:MULTISPECIES: GspH/FimT family pseudopilin [Acinetobacter]KHF77589.1 Type IV fimbrial biogenesis protein FimT [Acinetobacter sp. neg1]MEB6667719.1 GspH/FimT family pseudopilin [Acinetobacter vivianii]